jgi:hypothetical protein
MTNLATLYNCHPCKWWTCHYTTRNGKMTNWLISTTIFTNVHQLINRVQQNTKTPTRGILQMTTLSTHVCTVWVRTSSVANITFTFWFCHSHWLKFWALQLLLYHSPTVPNSPNLHLSCYIYVCMCVCINISTLLLWNEKIKKIPANFRNLFQKILSMSNSLNFHTLILAFQDTQKLTPRSR